MTSKHIGHGLLGLTAEATFVRLSTEPNRLRHLERATLFKSKALKELLIAAGSRLRLKLNRETLIRTDSNFLVANMQMQSLSRHTLPGLFFGVAFSFLLAGFLSAKATAQDQKRELPAIGDIISFGHNNDNNKRLGMVSKVDARSGEIWVEFFVKLTRNLESQRDYRLHSRRKWEMVLALKRENGEPVAAGSLSSHTKEMAKILRYRDEYFERHKRHDLLAKSNPEPAVGDILLVKEALGLELGIVSSNEKSKLRVQFIEDGELDPRPDSVSSYDKWWFVDRPTPTIEFRVWKSAKKTFEMEGKWVGVEGTDIVLEKSDGDTINVPLKKLSKADNVYVARNLDKLKRLDDPKSAGKHLGPYKKLFLARRMELLKSKNKGQVAAKDIANTSKISFNDNRLDLADRSLAPRELEMSPFNVSTSIQVPADSDLASQIAVAAETGLVGFSVHSRKKNVSALGVVNTKTGNAYTQPTEGKVSVISISPDGKRLLVYGKPSVDSGQLEVWSFENNELKQESTVPSEEILFGHLFDSDHGVVAGENEIFFFDIKERIKPSRIVTSERDFAKVELSNDQKSLLCFPASGPCKMHVLDIAKKSCLGSVEFGELKSIRRRQSEGFQVDLDGKTIWVQTSKKTFAEFDLQTGKQIRVVDAKTAVSSFTLKSDFPVLGPNLFQAWDRFSNRIYDAKNDVFLGSISDGIGPRISGMRLKRLSRSSRVFLTLERAKSGQRTKGSDFGRLETRELVAKRQSIDVEKINAAAAKFTPEYLIEFTKGVEVELALDLGDAGAETQLTAKLKSHFAAHGIKVVPESDFRLKVTYVAKARGYDPRGLRKKNIKELGAFLHHDGQQIWGTAQRELLESSPDRFNALTARSALNFNYPADIRTIKRRNVISAVWK